MAPQPELHLNLNFLNAGTYGSAWRWPGSDPRAFADIDHWVRTARIAERGTFDAVFLADNPGLVDRADYRPFQSLEPTIILAMIAAATERIGLIATISTTYNEPYNVARRVATLDHASRGRAGWNMVTTADRLTGLNFGLTEVLPHATRYRRAAEFADIVTALWDSWEDDALVGDPQTARFVDLGKVHPIDHDGPFFSVRGPLNVPRPPQGRPILVQAGGSDDGRALAARQADAVFSVAHSLPDAVAYAADLGSRTEAAGRPRGSILIFPGLVTVIGSTEEEARRREQALWDLVPIEYGLARLAGVLHVDPSVLKLDEPLPADLELPADHNHTFFRGALALAERGRLTVRDLIRAQGGGTGHRIVVSTPQGIADDIEAWFRSGAVAGFNVMPDLLPSGLEVFVDEVVPLLRKRGLFRHEYVGRTLRDHFGLARPSR